MSSHFCTSLDIRTNFFNFFFLEKSRFPLRKKFYSIYYYHHRSLQNNRKTFLLWKAKIEWGSKKEAVKVPRCDRRYFRWSRKFGWCVPRYGVKAPLFITINLIKKLLAGPSQDVFLLRSNIIIWSTGTKQ